MGWLWILLGVILALIVLFCWTRVGIHAVFQAGEVRLDAKAGPLRIQILPGKEKPERKEKKPKKEKPPKPAAEGEPKKSAFPKPALADIKEAVSTLWPPLKRALGKVGRGIRVYPLDLSLTLGGNDDPASAAQLYGDLNAGMWTAMPVLERLLVIPNPHLHIGIDFETSETLIDGELGVTARIGTLLAAGFTIGFPALKWFLHYRKKHMKQPPTPEETPVSA